ncbi:MAG: RidA family protein [Luminiphilus sp.]|jgi:2-iminobutanoate/2-iminopropanoate deaminase|nr:RidA family protein [Luminiphilus sp.]
MALKPHFSPAKRAGDFIFVSGQLPFDSDMKIVEGDVARQTEVVIEHISRALAGVGAELGDVVKTMVWLSDPADFPVFNATYAQFFTEGPPARATVGSFLMVEGALVEIEAIAHKPL